MKRRIVLLLALALALGGWGGCSWFSTGSAVLKAQSVTVDTVVMAGEMFFLVAGPFDALCPVRGLPVDACRGWRLFVEGHAPHVVNVQSGKVTFTSPEDATFCAAPTLASILAVLDRCGYKVAYPFVVQQYKDKKDVAVSVASTAEAIVRQLTGFGKAVNVAKGNVNG